MYTSPAAEQSVLGHREEEKSQCKGSHGHSFKGISSAAGKRFNIAGVPESKQ